MTTIGPGKALIGMSSHHHRTVQWLSLSPWDLQTEKSAFEGKFTSVYQMNQFGNLIEAERHILNQRMVG